MSETIICCKTCGVPRAFCKCAKKKESETTQELKKQLQLKDEALHRKNLELDALHFVWCSGGCDGGVHRWVDERLTEETVIEAERNTKRLREYWESLKLKRQKARNA